VAYPVLPLYSIEVVEISKFLLDRQPTLIILQGKWSMSNDHRTHQPSRMDEVLMVRSDGSGYTQNFSTRSDGSHLSTFSEALLTWDQCPSEVRFL
jgi:hypothetical protein